MTTPLRDARFGADDRRTFWTMPASIHPGSIFSFAHPKAESD
jgi:hypothetical protein